MLGVGAGRCAALLITLPPISLPSLAMLARSFRSNVLIIVAVWVVAFGFIGGLLAAALQT
jgi:uncharacterized membrane protein YraQ (UPF0718 family)